MIVSKEQAIRQGFLSYYNQCLLERGVISEHEYRQMKLKIQAYSKEKARRE